MNLVRTVVATAFVVCAAVTAQPPVAMSEAFPVATPESVGVDSKALQDIAAQIKKWVEDGDAVGAEIHIIKDRKTILHEGFGWMDRENQVAMKPDSIFCVRSMTKPVVGTAIQILIDEGKIALDDPVAKHLPAFANDKSKTITIRQLLNHTSGLPLTLKSKGIKGYANIREVAAEAGAHGPDFEPGSQMQYSDEGADALGAIVETVSGVPLDEFVRTRIIEPIGMTDAMCVLKPVDPRWSRISCNYAGTRGNWEKFWDNTKTDVIFPIFLASQGMYCSTTDYAKFLAMWMDKGEAAGGRRIISSEAVARALEPAIAFKVLPTGFDNCELFYGQNWMIYRQQQAQAPSRPMFGHGGSDGTYALAVPDRNLMVLYFTQSRGGTTVLGMDALIRPLIGQPPVVKEEVPSWTAEQTEPLLGLYHIAVLDEVGAVIRHGSQIALEIPSQQEFVLRWPDAKGQWAFDLAPTITLSFDEPVDGHVPGLVIHQSGIDVRGERMAPGGDLPSVDDLIALRRRTQGEDRLNALRNYRLTGEMHIESKKMDGKISLLIEGAGRFSQESIFEKAFERSVVRDGRVWTNSTGLSPTEQQGVFRGQKLRAFQPYRLGDWHGMFRDLAVLRRVTVGDEPVIEVRGEPADGGAVRMLVSEKTGLTLRERSLVVAKGLGAIPTTAEFEDYREVDGVKVPFRIVIESKLSGRIVIQFNMVETNLELPADAFEMKADK